MLPKSGAYLDVFTKTCSITESMFKIFAKTQPGMRTPHIQMKVLHYLFDAARDGKGVDAYMLPLVGAIFGVKIRYNRDMPLNISSYLTLEHGIEKRDIDAWNALYTIGLQDHSTMDACIILSSRNDCVHAFPAFGYYVEEKEFMTIAIAPLAKQLLSYVKGDNYAVVSRLLQVYSCEELLL